MEFQVTIALPVAKTERIMRSKDRISFISIQFEPYQPSPLVYSGPDAALAKRTCIPPQNSRSDQTWTVQSGLTSESTLHPISNVTFAKI